MWIVASICGNRSAAKKPWSTRPASIEIIPVANPQIAEARQNPVMPIKNRRFLPYLSPNRPPVAIREAKLNPYSATIKMSPVSSVFSALPITSSATLTIEKSI
ncbi:hypothetical protein D3C81_1659780 [compost metagenome]